MLYYLSFSPLNPTLLNRAFDLEKRQHLFANKVFQPPPSQTGLYGMGTVTDLGVDVQKAEDDIERKWSKKRADQLRYGGVGEEIEMEGLKRDL
jgi:hypothetical protein